MSGATKYGGLDGPTLGEMIAAKAEAVAAFGRTYAALAPADVSPREREGSAP